jgi:hypothetical protein
MSRALLILDSDPIRLKAASWVSKAPVGTRIEFKSPKRTLPQNDRFWAMLTDIAQQLAWHGKRLTADDWKLMMLDALKRSKQEEIRIVPNIDNTGFVNLSTSSSDLGKDEMSELMELMAAFGAKHGVVFHEPIPGDSSRDRAASAYAAQSPRVDSPSSSGSSRERVRA